ncbi:MAG TPA: hypothetical protein VMI11_12450 [Actinomycetes bacterium]|nr:hypothetical protein [Actinomycetes bacterium]
MGDGYRAERPTRQRTILGWAIGLGALALIAAVGIPAAVLGTRSLERHGLITSSSASGGGCWSPGGPDWLVEVAVVGGLGALILGGLWGGLLQERSGAPEAAPPPAYPRLDRVFRLVYALASIALLVGLVGRGGMRVALLVAGEAVILAVGLLIAGRPSRRATGGARHLRARTWALGVLFVLWVGASLAALVTMIATGTSGPTAC